MVVIICSLADSAMMVWFSFIGKEFWTALSERNSLRYYALLAKLALAIMCGLPVWILHGFYHQKLAIEWRSWMTQRTMDMFQASRKCAASPRSIQIVHLLPSAPEKLDAVAAAQIQPRMRPRA